MDPRRLTTAAAAFYPAVIIAGWAVVSLASPISPPRIANASAAIADQLAPSLAADADLALASPNTAAIGYAAVDAELATIAEFVAKPITGTPIAADTPVADTPVADTAVADTLVADKPVVDAPTAPTPPDEPPSIVVAALTDPAQVLPEPTPPGEAAAGAADPLPQSAKAAASRLELVGECLVAEACIDQYLWALYQRTPKEDTSKERELRKVTIKRKGKLVRVTRTFTRLVDQDFTWKDPKAAERFGMSMMDYVIGGMDRSFKLKLFYALQAAENAGLSPGITSAFRDDYRQSIASGLKAASNRSYHGGSLRGGYGRGLAADIVSTNGATRGQRWVSTEVLWKWVDANGKRFGIGRPYLDRDPPHVGPIDGQEYASRRGGTKTAAADVKKRHRHVAQNRPAAAKRPVVARASKLRTT